MENHLSERKNIQKQNRIVYAMIYILIVFVMILINTYTGHLDFLNSSNTIFIDPSEFNGDYSATDLIEEDGDNTFSYQLDLKEEAFKEMEGEEYKLIINGIKDNAIKVWFNDQLVISDGDLKEGHSMLRSGHVSAPIEFTALQENNRITMQTYAEYRTGTDDPIIISEKKTGEKTLYWLTRFNHQFLYLGIGLMTMSVFFVLVIYFLNPQGNQLLLAISLATFFASIYFLDFLPMNYLVTNYMTHKKLYFLFLAVGIFFYGYALYLLIRKKYIMILPITQLIYYLSIMIASNNMIQFKRYYDYFYASLLVVGLSFLVIGFRNIRKDNKIFILMLHFSTLIFIAVTRLSIGLKSNYFSLAMPIFIMFTVAFLPMIMTFDFLLDKQLKIYSEKEQKKVAYKQSLIDDLTGVWNKRYLENRLYELPEATVVAIIDLDEFKTINDTYGHLAGDRMLIHLTDILKKRLREEDDICRYGGDEFVVIFKDCKMKDAVNVIESIHRLIAENPVYYNDEKITTTISVGLSIVTEEVQGEKIIEYADRRLYVAKARGRNQTVYPNFV